MSSKITEIISAMEFAAQRGLRHFVHDDGKTRLALWREGPQFTPVTAGKVCKPASETPPIGTERAPEQGAGAHTVTAQLPGMCHLSPNPASPPFVTEGVMVEEGQTICIIEAMKVMTAVPAPRAGTVTKVYVANGSAISAGARLMDIRA